MNIARLLDFSVRPDLEALLTIFQASSSPEQAPWVLVLPGGGYVTHAVPKEGAEVANALAHRGINAAVLHYRLPCPELGVQGSARSLEDVSDALSLLRPHLGGQSLGVIGFSAGGHLAAMTLMKPVHIELLIGKSWQAPDFVACIYPVITLIGPASHRVSTTALLGENPARECIDLFDVLQHLDTPPPLFLVHGRQDVQVPFSHAQSLWQLLERRAQSQILMIEVIDGVHGFALTSGVHSGVWLDQFLRWIESPSTGRSYEETSIAC